MRYERAQEIIKSTETIEVMYKDKSVWIDNLNPTDETAAVSTFTESFTVPVIDLVEG